MIDVRQGDLILDTFYYDRELVLNPLFIFLYVLDVETDNNGMKTVVVAPPIYKNLANPPHHDYLLADVTAEYKIKRTKYWDYSSEDIRDVDGNKIGLHFSALSSYNNKHYNIFFKDYSSVGVESEDSTSGDAENVSEN